MKRRAINATINARRMATPIEMEMGADAVTTVMQAISTSCGDKTNLNDAKNDKYEVQSGEQDGPAS